MSLLTSLTTIHTPEQLGAILRDQRRAGRCRRVKLRHALTSARVGSQTWSRTRRINLARLLVLAKTLGLSDAPLAGCGPAAHHAGLVMGRKSHPAGLALWMNGVRVAYWTIS